ncbi:MAG: tryptophan synthase subunit alpha, partial [Acidobacteriia bacterium]|nr:tryptophan synthase subunit alpha [Terriglobia bacterium]
LLKDFLDLYEQFFSLLAQPLRNHDHPPPSTAEHVQEVAQFADAAVVGSAIVQAIEKSAPLGYAPQAVAELIRKLSGVSSQLSAGSTAAPR